MILKGIKEDFPRIDIIKYVLYAKTGSEEEIDRFIQNAELDRIGMLVQQNVSKNAIYTYKIIDTKYAFENLELTSDLFVLKFTHFFLKNLKLFNIFYIKTMLLKSDYDINRKILHIVKEIDARELIEELKQICIKLIKKYDGNNMDTNSAYIISFLNLLNHVEFLANSMEKQVSFIHIFPSLNMSIDALLIINQYVYNKIQEYNNVQFVDLC